MASFLGYFLIPQVNSVHFNNKKKEPNTIKQ